MEPPVQIILSPQSNYHPVTRAKSSFVSNAGLDAVQVNNIYAVIADNEDGFVITKCQTVLTNDFDGVLLEKCSDDGSLLLYRFSRQTQLFEKSKVVTSLTSMCHSKKEMFSVERSEIEEILYSINY